MSSDQDDSSTSQSVSDNEERPSKKPRYLYIKEGGRFQKEKSRKLICVCNNRGCGNKRSIHESNRDRVELRTWHTRHMARAVVENTINRVIEDMGNPYEHSVNNLFETYENSANETLNVPNTRNAVNLEDAAVMMAIQKHGLQKKICSCPNVMPKSNVLSQPPPFHRRPSSFTSSIHEEASTSSTNMTNDNLNVNDVPQMENDFLSQAVTVAIEKKGLNMFNADYV